MSLPRLLVLYTSSSAKKEILSLLDSIIENGTIDIRSKEFIDFGNVIFVDNVLCPKAPIGKNVIHLKI